MERHSRNCNRSSPPPPRHGAPRPAWSVSDHVPSGESRRVSHGRKNGTKVFVARDESASYDFQPKTTSRSPTGTVAKHPHGAPAPATNPSEFKDPAAQLPKGKALTVGKKGEALALGPTGRAMYRHVRFGLASQGGTRRARTPVCVGRGGLTVFPLSLSDSLLAAPPRTTTPMHRRGMASLVRYQSRTPGVRSVSPHELRYRLIVASWGSMGGLAVWVVLLIGAIRGTHTRSNPPQQTVPLSPSIETPEPQRESHTQHPSKALE